jgi:anaerobic selenocysteine-containing dehydrogenase
MADYRPLKRSAGTRKPYERSVTTICRQCNVGCGLTAYVQGNRIVDVQGDEDHPVSRGRLCAMGTAFVQGLDSPARITVPSVRKSLNDEFDQVEDWDNALDALADGLRKNRETHGAESLLIGCDPEAGPDFYFGAKRFARLWGTPYVFEPLEEPFSSSLPEDLNAPDGSAFDWVHSSVLFLVEVDPASTHPVLMSRILDARDRGATIVVADSRFTATMSKADVQLLIRPETGNRLGMAVLKILLENGQCDSQRIDAGFSDSQAWSDSYAQAALERIAEPIGLSLEKIRELGGLLGTRSPATVITGKALAYLSHYGIWRTIAGAMNWSGVEGGGWYPIDSGRPGIDVSADIEEGPWKDLEWLFGDHHTLAKYVLDTGKSGQQPEIQALIGSGNCLNHFLAIVRPHVADMDLISHFGLFPNDTYKLSHMVFPAAAQPEQDTLCFSNDRAVQWAEKILEPKPGCRSGLDFWTGLAQRFGWEDHFPWIGEDGCADHRSFYDWLLEQSPLLEGTSVESLQFKMKEKGLVHWPTTDRALVKPKAPMFPTSDGKIAPTRAESTIQQTTADTDRLPFVLQVSPPVSRMRDIVSWWPWTHELENDRTIQINPRAAALLGIENGNEIVMEEPDGEMEGLACLSRMVPDGMVWTVRPFTARRVLVRKKGMTSQEALNASRELLP